MNSVFDGVPAGVIHLSSDMRILAANREMGALIGRESGELSGEALDVLLSAPSRILFQTHVYPALKADGRVEEVLLTLASSTGDPIPVLLNAVRSPGEADPGFVAVIVRIRARSRWETDLLAATRALERERVASQRLADELASAAADLELRYAEEQRTRAFRDAFIGVVSHELRTPITTIYGMSHLLRERYASLAPETVRDHLGDIEAESDRLRRLTEDLLVLSRAEGGRLEVASEPIVMRNVVQAAVESERARWAAHTFVVDAPAGLPIVLGEDVYVGQVVTNYLSNAAKYSPAGTTVQVALSNEEEGIAVRVIDAGPGLGDQVPDRLFDLFYRSPDALRQAPGAGIGLFVCRELINAMGGRIWAAAAPPPAPTGAEFGFWLPAAVDDALD
ncbi:MAG TPA: ATP-binding protein [Methylomirabilota bacterium]|nr:ATP-binding protein [Methylomirabilota bacterium]